MANEKLIAFDLDGTLALSKSAIPWQIESMLSQLLAKYEVCIISGGKYEQFQRQVLGFLSGTKNIHRLHLLPTCGTRYYRYSPFKHGWDKVYSEDLSEEESIRATIAIEDSIKELGIEFEELWGEQIEDRGGQITFSALGQEAPMEEKEQWDASGELRASLQEAILRRVPYLEVRVGGSTSIDITKKGIDKSYGMHRLLHILNISKDETVFYGDKLQPGGNDHPVRAMGIECIDVADWYDTWEKVTSRLIDIPYCSDKLSGADTVKIKVKVKEDN